MEKIKRLAEAYGKQKTLKDRIKFVSDNPIELEGFNEKKFSISEKIKGYFVCIVRTKLGFFIFLLIEYSCIYLFTLNYLILRGTNMKSPVFSCNSKSNSP